MFEHLVESGPRVGQRLRPTISALAVHAGVALAAIRLSRDGHSPAPHGILPIPVIFEAPPGEPLRPGRLPGARPSRVVVGAPPAPAFDGTLPPLSDPGIPRLRTVPASPHEVLQTLAVGDSGRRIGLGEVSLAEGGSLTADEAPVLIRAAEAVFPPILRAAGVGGVARIEFVVDTLGLPDKATVRVVDADRPAFGEAAMEAVLRSQFRPGRANGRPVRVRVRQVVRFTLG